MAEQIRINSRKAEAHLRESVWQSYRQIAILNKEEQIEFLDENSSLDAAYLFFRTSYAYLIMSWIRSARVCTQLAWRQSGQSETEHTSCPGDFYVAAFSRLLNPDILKDTIAKGAQWVINSVGQKIRWLYCSTIKNLAGV